MGKLNDWISTKEKLPETDECVLAVINGTYRNISFVDAILIAECLDGKYGEKCWYIEGYPEISNLQVDYWMPLPEPPEEKIKLKGDKTMENFIQINGQRINLTEEQTQAIKRAYANDSGDAPAHTVGDVPIGETCNIGEFEFIVLEHLPEGTALLLKDLLYVDEDFGENNDYRGSNVDKLCNIFAERLEQIVGGGNLVEHEVDLTSDDGLKDYGTVMRKASLLTTEQYRRYVEILDKYKVDKWWWLATPYSTPKHEDTDCIKCVSPLGRINRDCAGSGRGVRPFLRFKSSILVSCED